MTQTRGGVRILFNLPNLVTLINLSLGMLALKAIINSKFLTSFFFITLATIADFFDGLVARVTKQENPIGRELDSLADIVSFGVAPSAMLLSTNSSLFAISVAIIYTMWCS